MAICMCYDAAIAGEEDPDRAVGGIGPCRSLRTDHVTEGVGHLLDVAAGVAGCALTAEVCEIQEADDAVFGTDDAEVWILAAEAGGELDDVGAAKIAVLTDVSCQSDGCVTIDWIAAAVDEIGVAVGQPCRAGFPPSRGRGRSWRRCRW